MMECLVLRDLDTGPVARRYENVLEQLRQGDFRSAEAKKLRGSGLYRAKLDDKNRLLFKLAEHGGRPWLLILEVVRNHDYAKARFLNGGDFTEDDFEPVPAPSAATSPPEALVYVNPSSPILHFLDKPLSFDEAQRAVFETPLPLIVTGSAGSGKTALTLEKLKTIPGRGLYLTRSSYLVQNARSLYFASGYSNEGQEVPAVQQVMPGLRGVANRRSAPAATNGAREPRGRCGSMPRWVRPTTSAGWHMR